MRACSLSELPDEGAVRVEIDGKPICIARSQGEVTGKGLECWLHGSCFDLRTGMPSAPPATEPVAVYPVTINDGRVYVDLAPINQS